MTSRVSLFAFAFVFALSAAAAGIMGIFHGRGDILADYPEPNPPLNLRFTYVSAGSNHSLGITHDGRLWAWGTNSFGRLGLGDTIDRLVPTLVCNENVWVGVWAGGEHSLGMTDDGKLWAWGRNNHGQIGDGTNEDSHSPKLICDQRQWSVVSTGGTHTLGVTSDGELFAWGNNVNGRLGNGTTVNVNVPTLMCDERNWTSVSAGGSHSIGLTSDRAVWTWGDNNQGQLGNGLSGWQHDRHSPSRIDNLANTLVANSAEKVVAGSNLSIVISNTGGLWIWGFNGNGAIGDGTTTNRVVPTRIRHDLTWESVSAHAHVLAKTDDGALWSWGMNWRGQRGDGTRSPMGVASTPVRIDSLENNNLIPNSIVNVATGVSTSFALSSDYGLWSWGAGASGELGDGTFGFVQGRPVPYMIAGQISTAEELPIPDNVAKTSETIVSWTFDSELEDYIDGFRIHVYTDSETVYQVVAANIRSFDLATLDLGYGAFAVRVRAIASDGSGWLDSPLSEEIIIVVEEEVLPPEPVHVQLLRPTITITGETISWVNPNIAAGNGQFGYALYVNDVRRGDTIVAGTYELDLGTLGLEPGTYKIRLRALGGEIVYNELTTIYVMSPLSEYAEFYVEDDEGGPGPQQPPKGNEPLDLLIPIIIAAAVGGFALAGLLAILFMRRKNRRDNTNSL